MKNIKTPLTLITIVMSLAISHAAEASKHSKKKKSKPAPIAPLYTDSECQAFYNEWRSINGALDEIDNRGRRKSDETRYQSLKLRRSTLIPNLNHCRDSGALFGNGERSFESRRYQYNPPTTETPTEEVKWPSSDTTESSSSTEPRGEAPGSFIRRYYPDYDGDLYREYQNRRYK